MTFRNDLPFDRRLDFELQQFIDLRELLRAQPDLLAGTYGCEKFHPANGRQKEERPRVSGVGGSGCDACGLSERFRENDAGHKRIAGEMSGENRVVGVESR